MNIPQREGLYHFPIDADFAWQMMHTLSGGVDEWEVAALCVSEEVVAALGAKIEKELDNRLGRNLSLWLTEDECMALASAGQNCQTKSLPKVQQDRIEHWHEKWKKSAYGTELGTIPNRDGEDDPFLLGVG